jgi:hypothetical protein
MALDKFFRYITDFRSVAALAGKASLLAPFVPLLSNVGPPWPNRAGVIALTTLAQMLVVIYVFQFYASLPQQRLKRYLRLFFLLLIGCFVIYFSLYSLYVFESLPEDPSSKSRDVKGFILKPDVQKILLPNHTEDELLKGSEWDPFVIYEPWTIHTMRLSLLLAWILFFVCISGIIAVFVFLQQRSLPSTGQASPASQP